METTARRSMLLDLVVCPGCRTLVGDQLHVRTLARTGDLLVCECGRRYPIVDSVPLLLRDPAAYVRDTIATIVERDLPPDVAAALAESGSDEDPYPRQLEHLSIYLDAHWGDHAEPPPDGPGSVFGVAELAARVAERSRERVANAVELGCSTGRIVAELAAGADHVVGLDLHFGALRRARRLLAGERLAYNRRITGRHYATAHATGRTAPNADLVCGDALDPPFLPRVFQRVVALNMLDSVHDPRTLLAVVDGLCAPGGEILLSSPYSWQSSIVPEHHRLGAADPASAVRATLRDGYAIEEEAELSWTLRRDARSAAVYRTHYIRARKR
jgi:SAM-dependent methyltransferase/uncharacterized protein YbaR (Trm112 family)